MRIIIIGGVAGGAAAAARARRLNEEAEIIMIERGQYVSFANCGLPYYAGEVIKERKRLLVQTPESLSRRFNLDVRVLSEVTGIDSAERTVTVKDIEKGSEYKESYDKLILSPGAAPFRPPFEGGDLDMVHTVRTVPDIDVIKEKLDSGNVKRAVVVGGGFIGIEMAENLIERKVDTHLVEMLDQVMPPFDKDMAVILHRQLAFHGVKLALEQQVTAVRKTVEGAVVETSSGEIIPCDMVILAVGVRPETDLARRAGLDIGEYGIRTDERMRTSDENIFAVGDVVEVKNPVTGGEWYVPLAWPAAKQGVIAVNNIFGKEDSYGGTYGTSVVKVFKLTAAMSGATEKVLKKAGMPYEKIYTHPANHAGYYPGAMQMSMKLLFAPDTGKVLGVQVVGREGTDKRVDVISVAIKAGLTVNDLSDLELCYAPPYGSAKDAVNLAGMASVNHMEGLSPLTHWDTLSGEEFLLDVRTPVEFEKGTVKGAVNIPVDELRDRLSEVPKDVEVSVFCQVGIRGHIATRILLQNGYKAKNVSGGYLTYQNHYDANVSGTSLAMEDGPLSETFCTAPKGQPDQGTGRLVKEIDATGLQCPGPIVRLKEAVAEIREGDMVSIKASDMGFAEDIPKWAAKTGNVLVDMKSENDGVIAVIMKGVKLEDRGMPAAGDNKGTTLVVFSGDMDKVMASFIIARSAAASGRKVTMFFTFWGLNALKKKGALPVKKDLLSRMFGWMMPGSVSALKLSRMNMMGIGTAMMKYVMKTKNVMPIEDMMKGAISDGVDIVACSMSMDVMGIKQEELVEGVKVGGAAYYVAEASGSGHNLFI